MSTRRKSFLFGVGMVVLAAAPIEGLSQDVRVRELWATKGSDQEPFGSIKGMVEAPDGRFLVADPVNEAIYSVGKAGQDVVRIAREGHGPGEVQAPTLMARTPDGGVAVWDVSHNMILLLGEKLRERDRVQLRYRVVNPKGFVVLHDGSFLLGGGSFRNTFGLHHISPDGTHLGSWLPAPDEEGRAAQIHLAGAPVSLAREDGAILFTNPAPHRIAKLYPNEQGRVKEIASDAEVLQAIAGHFFQERDVNGRMVVVPQWYYPQSRAVFQTADGRILNVITNREDRYSLWEIYNETGVLISRVEVPKAYHPYWLTEEENVLASYPDPVTGEPIAVLLAVDLT